MPQETVPKNNEAVNEDETTETSVPSDKAAKDEARHQNSQMFAGVRLMCSNKCIAKFVFIYEVAF